MRHCSRVSSHLLVFLALSLTAALPLFAQDDDHPPTPLSTSSLGKALAADGLALDLSYSGLKLAKLGGGGQRDYPYGYGLDFALALDTGKAGLYNGGTFRLDLQKGTAQGVTTHPLGRGQHLTTTDNYYVEQLSEIWYRQDLFDGALGLKVGKQDAGSDFQGCDWGGSFIAAPITQSPTIPMPTYPKSKVGAALFLQPADVFTLQAGSYQGQDLSANGGFDTTFEAKDGRFEIVEASLKEWFLPERYQGTFRVGYWRHTGRFVSLIGTETEVVQGAKGWYGLLDQPLWRASGEKGARALGLVLQYGYSPEHRLEVSRNIGVGLVLKAPFAGREHDEAGIGYARGRVQNDDYFGGATVSEVAWEAYYRAQVCSWLALQPDFQVVPAVRGSTLGRETLLGLKFVITP